MSCFVLIHGGMHGAWCWSHLVPELERLGHDAIAVDVPLERAVISFDQILAPVLDLEIDWGPNVVLIGHSLGGLIASHVARQRSVGAVVFLCSMVSPEIEEHSRAQIAMLNPELLARQTILPDGRLTMTRENAEWAFFHDVDDHIREWALSRLVPVNPKIYQEMAYIDRLPECRLLSVVASQDRMMRDIESYRELMHDRLGVQPISIDSGHSPFLSRPEELARILTNAALTS